ncbi:GNAT family protein [Pseudonocardia eucalypti]|uniref:GNAT family protein n=1 Tax=Pseudonocardia eucalypti TaxID=648755 RepID=A0ABP9QS48_9PSEU|nr:RimJ/RimL family protein N-acetyltransferase [Pseudonocardia eucalypti]
MPTASELVGRYCRLERLDPDRHAEGLFAADRRDTRGESWTYLPYGPFPDLDDYRKWLAAAAEPADPRFYAIVDAAERPLGVLSLMRMQPEFGVIEVGHVHYSPALQRTREATEAQYLVGRYVFDELGYRRWEWKCDALNDPSRAAAERLGFRYEGTFRQATVVKGRNRDTAWYSILDAEWPALRDRFEQWLRPDNFEPAGRQRSPL